MSFVQVWPVAVRRVLVRRPWVYWIVVLATAAGSMATALERVDRIDAARDAWGETRQVLIAQHDAAPGELIAVAARDVPLAVVPFTAVESGDETQLMARQHVSTGEIVTSVDVAPVDRSGPTALVPDGWLAVPIVESPASGAEIGARVQIVGDGIVLAVEGLVVGHHDDVTLVAVPADIAPMIPVAAQTNGLAVLLVP